MLRVFIAGKKFLTPLQVGDPLRGGVGCLACLWAIMKVMTHRVTPRATAYNNVDREAIVITAYEPDPAVWSIDFTRRK